MKILIIDNYDSFTFNLVQLISKTGAATVVEKNNSITPDGIKLINPDKILISPGPGTPENAGNCLEIVNKFKRKLPILGVCLGMQVIAKLFKAEIRTAKYLLHGKISLIEHDGKTIFYDIPQKFKACRYHSLEVKRNSIPDSLQISAETNDGVVMGIRHKNFKLEGIQFHPEAILTEHGEKLIRNWLSFI